mgnify:CR=1 FL=1
MVYWCYSSLLYEIIYYHNKVLVKEDKLWLSAFVFYLHTAVLVLLQHHVDRRPQPRPSILSDFSAAWSILCAVVLLDYPVTPNAENNRETDCAGNPLHPTSTGNSMSRSANPCLCTLSSIHHVWPFSAHFLRHTSLSRGQSTR